LDISDHTKSFTNVVLTVPRLDLYEGQRRILVVIFAHGTKVIDSFAAERLADVFLEILFRFLSVESDKIAQDTVQHSDPSILCGAGIAHVPNWRCGHLVTSSSETRSIMGPPASILFESIVRRIIQETCR
jgi:hypothetical protein